MKKYISILLAVAMLLSLAACGGNDSTETTGDPAQNAAPVSYTYEFDGMMGKETAQIDLNPDYTCKFWLPGNDMIQDVYAGIYSREGNVVTIFGLKNTDKDSAYALPGLWDWIVEGNATVTVDDDAKTFVPVGPTVETVDISGSFTYTFAGLMGEETAQIDLAADGTCQFCLPGNPMIADVYAGTYTISGTTVSIVGLTNVDPASPYATPGLWDWIVNGNATVTVDMEAKTFTPGETAAEGPAGPIGGSEESKADHAGVAYASNSAAQVCDIYLPEGVEKAPVIVLVHGGGFMFGDQGMDVILPVIDKALEKGYAVVSVDYRKATEAVFPAALGDVKAAVRFVKAHAMEYGFDPEHIAIWGESAGAYLSLMTALTPNVAELNADVTDYAEIPGDVTALVSFYAPVEFYTLYEEAGKPDSAASSFESKFLGQDIMADKDATYKTYWETYAASIPTDLMAWIQAGDADARVPHTQSVHFADRLKKYIPEGNIAYSIIAGADHEDDLFYTDENLDAVFAWLDGFMKG